MSVPPPQEELLAGRGIICLDELGPIGRSAPEEGGRALAYVLIPGGIGLEILGEDGALLANAYEHGWRPGTERVHVRLAFTVESFDPGATLTITNVLVR